jgi:glycosyltransferase involved in cell wall biosynthesis
MPIAIRAVGPFRGASGYDRVTQGFARGLIQLGVDVQLIPLPGWSPDLPSTIADDLLSRHTKPVDADVAVHFMMPDRCQPAAGLPNVNYTMFEATRIPPTWADRARDHDLVIVPSETCRRAWRGSGVPAARLRVCGLGVDAAFFAGPAAPLDLADSRGRPVHSYRTRFLHVGELRPRKNHLGLLRTWITATTSDDDAILILKSAAPPHLVAAFRQDVARMRERTGREFSDAAPIVFVNEVFDDLRMRALYRAATHYISMSHAEGWDMPMMEAAASGLSLLTPDQPTYRGYLGPSDADWIGCQEAGVHFEGQAGIEDLAYFHGLRWWQPDEADAARLLADVIATGRGCPPPTQRLLTEFTWARASQRLLDLLGELCPPRSPIHAAGS